MDLLISLICFLTQLILTLSKNSTVPTERFKFNARIDFEGNSNTNHPTQRLDGDSNNPQSFNRFVDTKTCLSPLRSENYTRIKEILMTGTDCVRIYREEDCHGPFITLRSRYIFYAFRWNHVNDKASSLGPCDEECSAEHIHNIPSNAIFTFHEDKTALGAQGYNATVNVTGCVIIPRIFNRTLSKHIRVSDLDRLDDSICIEVHEHSNCTGLSVSYRPKFPWAGAVNRQTRQVWRTYRSVSVCGYNCIRQWENGMEILHKLPPGPFSVVLYDEPDFNGNFKEVNISKGCVDIRDEWEGESLSIKTYGQCIIAYEQFGCTKVPKNYFLLDPSNSNLHANLLTFKTRSIKLCYNDVGYDGSIAKQFDGRNGVRIFFKDSLRTQYIDASTCTSSPEFESELPTIYWTQPLSGCINLYRYENCRGEHITKISNDSNEDYYWQDETRTLITYRSVGPCQEDCNSRKDVQRNTSFPVEVFLYTNYSKIAKRNRELVTITGWAECVLIPRILQRRVEFYEINRQEDLCFELHRNWNCTGGSTKGRDRQSDVDRTDNSWKFATASSISHCGYSNCRNEIIESRHSSRNQSILADTIDPNILRLFDEPNFNGNFKDLNMSQGCLNISEEWEGGSQSIEIYNQCVNLYSQFGCSNLAENLLLDDSNKKSQANFPFKWGIKSMNLCRKNRDGFSESVDQDRTSEIVTFTILGLLGFGLVVSFGIIIYLKRRVQTVLSKKEIQDFQAGFDNFENAEITAENQPYDQSYEIPKEDITIDMSCPLGSGAYAVVYKGRVKRPGTSEELQVAIKTMKPFSSVEYTRALLVEIKTMIYMGQHQRIVELIGCCTQKLGNGELYVMTELCQNGSLEGFLRNHKASFINFVDEDGQLCLPKVEANEEGYVSSRMEPISLSHFNTVHSLQWAMEIAEGMEYLVFKKVIHGDLATRNVLLDSDFNIKISDFGLARQLYQYSQYIKKSHAPLPWRWLAIESLQSFSFSAESDVWAYGVTIWEIFTLGHIPYPDRSWDETFLISLCQGLRLSNPQNAPLELFKLMTKCWMEVPSERISFSDCKIQISKILDRYSEFTGYPSYNKDYMYVSLSD